MNSEKLDAGSSTGGAAICEICCEQIAGAAMDNMPRVNWSAMLAFVLDFCLLAVLVVLGFVGQALFFVIAICMFRIPGRQKQQQMLDDADQKRRDAYADWDERQQAYFMDKAEIDSVHDQYLGQDLQRIRDLEAELRAIDEDGWRHHQYVFTQLENEAKHHYEEQRLSHRAHLDELYSAELDSQHESDQDAEHALIAARHGHDCANGNWMDLHNGTMSSQNQRG